MTFEAPRELLDPGTRDRTLQEIRELRRRPRARARLLEGLRARRDLEAAPGLRRGRPERLPGRHVGPPRRAVRRGAGARHHGPAHAHRPGPALGHQDQARQRDPPEHEGVPGLRHRGRPPLRRPRRRVVDLERAQPPAVPAPAVRARRSRSPRASTATSSSPASAAWPPRATAPTPCCSARPRRAAPRASSRRWPSCAARCAWTATTTASGRCKRVEAGGFAHHAYTTRVGPRFRPPDRDDVTIGVLSRLTRRSTARPARARSRRGLGVYLTEFGIQSTPDPFVGVTLARQAEYLAIAEHMAYVNPRVRSFSQYLLSDDKPRKGTPRRALRRLRVRPAPLQRARRSRPTTPSACRWRPRPTGAPTSSGAACGRSRPRPRSRSSPRAGRARSSSRCARVTTNHRGVFGLRAKHHDKQRYRVQWTAPDGKVWLGPPIRAT